MPLLYGSHPGMPAGEAFMADSRGSYYNKCVQMLYKSINNPIMYHVFRKKVTTKRSQAHLFGDGSPARRSISY